MATEPNIRKLVVFRETIRSEGGCELEKPLRKCAAAAVIKNPYAGAYQEDLTLLMEVRGIPGRLSDPKGGGGDGD